MYIKRSQFLIITKKIIIVGFHYMWDQKCLVTVKFKYKPFEKKNQSHFIRFLLFIMNLYFVSRRIDIFSLYFICTTLM